MTLVTLSGRTVTTVTTSNVPSKVTYDIVITTNVFESIQKSKIPYTSTWLVVGSITLHIQQSTWLLMAELLIKHFCTPMALIHLHELLNISKGVWLAITVCTAVGACLAGILSNTCKRQEVI